MEHSFPVNMAGRTYHWKLYDVGGAVSEKKKTCIISIPLNGLIFFYYSVDRCGINLILSSVSDLSKFFFFFISDKLGLLTLTMASISTPLFICFANSLTPFILATAIIFLGMPKIQNTFFSLNLNLKSPAPISAFDQVHTHLLLKFYALSFIQINVLLLLS